jgi:hypothetical protein
VPASLFIQITADLSSELLPFVFEMDDEDCEIIKQWMLTKWKFFFKSKGLRENVTAILNGKSLSKDPTASKYFLLTHLNIPQKLLKMF